MSQDQEKYLRPEEVQISTRSLENWNNKGMH